jgi:hypothetical protein
MAKDASFSRYCLHLRGTALSIVKTPVKILIAPAVVLVLALLWQIAWANIAHNMLTSDLREATAQIGGRIGLDAPSSDDDLRNLIIKRAADHGIALQPDQITIERFENTENSTWGLKVSTDYNVTIGFFGFT